MAREGVFVSGRSQIDEFLEKLEALLLVWSYKQGVNSLPKTKAALTVGELFGANL
jgi:hypothetical protein